MNPEKNKNIGHFLAFSKEWFICHQRILLWLLNTPVIKRWFRYVLRINHDISINEKIAAISPNSFTFGEKLVKRRGKYYIERTTDFRTHPKFAKRIYYAFKPLWWTFHIWDLFADVYAPKLSFGYSTLTVYPEAYPATTAGDGKIWRATTNESWATITGGNGTNYNLSQIALQCYTEHSASTSDQFDSLFRSITNFDTSSLTAGITITSAVISVYGTDHYNNLAGTNPDLHVAGATPASYAAVEAADYQDCLTTSFGSVAYGSFSTVAYNDISLNASGLAGISKTGVSSFSWQLSWDINRSYTGTHKSGVPRDATFNFNSADKTGTDNDPKLVVTYSTSVTYTKTIQAKARIQHAGISKSIQAKGRIEQANLSKSISAKANILKSFVNTIQAKANISSSKYYTIRAKADIQQPGVSSNIQAKTDIKNVDVAKDIQAKARIQHAGIISSIQAKSRIQNMGQSKTVQAKARISHIDLSKTVQAKARINVKGVLRTSEAKARIHQGGVVASMRAKARIWAFRAGFVQMRSTDQDGVKTLNDNRIL